MLRYTVGVIIVTATRNRIRRNLPFRVRLTRHTRGNKWGVRSCLEVCILRKYMRVYELKISLKCEKHVGMAKRITHRRLSSSSLNRQILISYTSGMQTRKTFLFYRDIFIRFYDTFSRQIALEIDDSFFFNAAVNAKCSCLRHVSIFF